MLTTIFAAAALVAVASAQTASSTVSQSMPPTATAGFNSGNVSSSDAFLWCHAQLNSCPEICGGSTTVNTCDQNAFTYSCICANGTEPDCTAYEQTLPFYICQATFQQCINAHPNDAQGQATCTSNEQCGTGNATAADTTASGNSGGAAATSLASSVSSAQASASSVAASVASSASASASAKSDANTQTIATGAFAALLMAAFKLVL